MTKQTITQAVSRAFRSTQAKVATGTALVLGSAAAYAQEAPGAEAAFNELRTQASDMAGYAWPVVVGVVGSLLAIGLFKKFANRAT